MRKITFNKTIAIFFLSLFVIIASVIAFPKVTNALFDENQAIYYLEKQLSSGARTPGSDGHKAFREWAAAELTASGWDVSFQSGTYNQHEIVNIIASREDAGEDAPWILLGAHYDTRLLADADPDPANQSKPVPGANDGASGVAVLMELASSLPKDLDKNIWLVLLDAEDQGKIEGWDHWCIGSTALAQSFEEQGKKPDAVIIADMVGDRDLNIYREGNSTGSLTDEIWKVAADEGYSDYFINEEKYRMQDDHVPFLQIGIPAVDLIDFDYPAWHTIADDISNVSAESLAIVGNVLYTWLTTK